MKQKIQDLVLLIQKSRKAQVFVAVGLCSILFLMVYGQQPKRRKFVKPPPKPQEENLVANSSAADVIEAFKVEVEELKSQSVRLQKESEQNKRVMDQFEDQVVSIFKKMLNRMTETEQKLDDALDNIGQLSSKTSVGAAGAPVVTFEDQPPQEDPTELVEFGDMGAPEPAPPSPPPVNRVAFVGAGDSVSVELISGVNAPTDGTPYPALFKLVGSVTGPDGSELPLGEARLIAAAQGSLSDARALFRLTSLNISLPNGERKVYNVDGWIVGEDGIHGMPGIPVDPIGKAVLGAGIVGAVQGVGQGLQSANQTVRQDFQNAGGISAAVTGSAGEFALGSGVAGAAREWNNILRERYRDMTPVIKLYSGRKATAVFSQSLPIEGLYNQIADPNQDFDSLD